MHHDTEYTAKSHATTTGAEDGESSRSPESGWWSDIQRAANNAVEGAIESGRGAAEKLVEASNETVPRTVDYLAKDAEVTRQDARRAAEFVRDRLHPSRLQSGALATGHRWLRHLGSRLSRWADEADRARSEQTGAEVGPCTLTCDSCGHELHMKRHGRVPPCGNCHGTAFRRSY